MMNRVGRRLVRRFEVVNAAVERVARRGERQVSGVRDEIRKARARRSAFGLTAVIRKEAERRAERRAERAERDARIVAAMQAAGGPGVAAMERGIFLGGDRMPNAALARIALL